MTLFGRYKRAVGTEPEAALFHRISWALKGTWPVVVVPPDEAADYEGRVFPFGLFGFQRLLLGNDPRLLRLCVAFLGPSAGRKAAVDEDAWTQLFCEDATYTALPCEETDWTALACQAVDYDEVT